MNSIEKILRKKTMNLFSDEWYHKTSEEIGKSNENKKGYVYFLKDKKSKEIKIGKTLDINKRMNNYRTYSSSGIFLIGVIYSDNYSKLEKSVLLKLSKYKIKGEWFDLDLSYVKNFINSNNGELIGGVWNRDSYELSGRFFNINKTYKNNDSFFYDLFYEKLDNLSLNQRYSKSELYKQIIKIDKKYKTLSKKKSVEIIKQYCSERNYIMKQTISNGVRYFTMFKK